MLLLVDMLSSQEGALTAYSGDGWRLVAVNWGLS